jgi:hypothetical protein
MPFPNTVNQQPSPGVEGSRASHNPVLTYVTGPGGLISAPTVGVTIARFAWAIPQTDGSEQAFNTSVAVAAGLARTPNGFVANLQQGLNTIFLSEAGMTMIPGQNMQLFTRGDFWARNTVSSATKFAKIFANLFTGQITTAAAGSTISAASVTASFATTVMTVTATTGVLAVGQSITGAGIPANTYIASLGTGTGGAGTYNLTTAPGTVSSETVIASNYIETKFSALSNALTAEIVKIGYGD